MTSKDKRLDRIKSSDVRNTLQLYPDNIQNRILTIRQAIFDLASENSDIGDIEETRKWGEPSYLAKSASTVRLAWKNSIPGKYGVYFNCKSKLIGTFKELYPTIFIYDGNRAIILNVAKDIPEELNHCLLSALTYHKVKHLNLLGA
ncbi:MAG: hypothetical protein ACI88H_001262 [Cocleimonas sp.]|jgi:hypothetical protein